MKTQTKIKIIALAIAISILTAAPTHAIPTANKDVNAMMEKVAKKISEDKKEIQKEAIKKAAPKAQKVIKETIAKEVDPCEAYKVSYEAYVVCQDRTRKIQRMIDAREKRQARYKKKSSTAKK